MTSLVIIVEGTIGSGKTSLVKKLSNQFGENCVCKLENFIRDCPYLSEFYNAADRSAARLQFKAAQYWFIGYYYSLNSWLKSWLGLKKVIIIDRCVIGSLVFIQEAFNSVLINKDDYTELENAIRSCMVSLRAILKGHPCLFVDLTCNYRTSLARIALRSGFVEYVPEQEDPLCIKLTESKLYALEKISVASNIYEWSYLWPNPTDWSKIAISCNTTYQQPEEILILIDQYIRSLGINPSELRSLSKNLEEKH